VNLQWCHSHLGLFWLISRFPFYFLRFSCIFIYFWGSLPFFWYRHSSQKNIMPSFIFIFVLKSSSILFLRSSSISSWVNIRLHTKNQLPRLPESDFKFTVGWVASSTHYQFRLQLMLRLSWAVTKFNCNCNCQLEMSLTPKTKALSA
jgi:hypothetical protein